ncbi:MAG: hypothetical protein ACYDCB_05000, partial [Candidatus Dormibacteria bacterium]
MNLFGALRAAMHVPELRRKLLITLGLIIVFRMLATITIPGVNSAALAQLYKSNSLLGLINLFSGSGVSSGSNAGISIVALGL